MEVLVSPPSPEKPASPYPFAAPRRLRPNSLKLSQSHPTLSAARSTYVALRTSPVPRLPVRSSHSLSFNNVLTPILSPPGTPAASSLASLSSALAGPRTDAHHPPSTARSTNGQQDYFNKAKLDPPPPPKWSDNADVLRGRSASKSTRRPISTIYAPLAHHSPAPAIPRRRASMPLMRISLSKPLPDTPPPVPSPTTKPAPEDDCLSLTASASAPPDVIRLSRSSRTSSNRGTSKSTSRARFHIHSDNEDDADELTHRPRRHRSDSGSSTKSRIQHSVENTVAVQDREKKRQEDDARRYHALLELLMTEVGYLRDLRALVTIYLQHFPTISTRIHLPSSSFMRASPSPSFISSTFGGHSRSNSQSQFLAHPPPPPSAFPHNVPHAASAQPAVSGSSKEYDKGKEKEKDRHKVNRLVSDTDVILVARNAKELLEFHERFVHDLRISMAPFDLTSALDESASEADMQKRVNVAHTVIDDAVTSVTNKFTHMAQTSVFSIYESFCSGHPEATDLVRKIQQQHTSEWDVFEQKCSHLIAHSRSQSRASVVVVVDQFGGAPLSAREASRASMFPPAVAGSSADVPQLLSRRARRHSTSSVSMMSHPFLSPGTRNSANLDVVQVKSDPSSEPRGKGPRLSFMDYLIKPVQRICKYPLLLDQLKTRQSLGGVKPDLSADAAGDPEADESVDQAARAMREVVALVDEARRKRDVVIKSSLIASRVVAWSSSHPSKESTPPGHLTQEFMASLGICMLSGSLDVMHYDATGASGSGTVKVKYLGAFLYPGGYLVLVKVGKAKVYEPRHWFSLTGFEVVDVDDAEALLPCSFGLFRRDHYFELAAACQKEKEAWLAALRDSMAMSAVWTSEPSPSLQSDVAAVVSPQDNEPAEVLALSRAHSRRTSVEITDEPESYGTESHGTAEAPLREEVFITRPVMPASRRSSATSVKGFFSSSASDATILIRSTPSLRQNVERALLDVFSEICLTVRFQAQTHEQELFQAPKSYTTLGMTGGMGLAAKSRLSKRESVVVPRRKSFVDGADIELEAQASVMRKSTLSRAKSLASRRQGKKSLRIMAPLPSRGPDDDDAEPASTADPTVDSPTPLSQCSSVGTSQPGSAAASPAADARALSPEPGADVHYASVQSHEPTPQPEYLTVVEPDWRPKRARSMVDNVRGFFYARPSSPAPSMDASSSHASNLDSARTDSPQDWTPPAPSSRLTRWWKGSLRRRVQSAPEVPRDDPGTTIAETSFDSSGTIRPPTDTPDVPEEDPDLQPSENALVASPDATLRKPKSEMKHYPPTRRRSLFSAFPNSRRDMDPAPSTGGSPRKNMKTVSFIQRLNPKTSPAT